MVKKSMSKSDIKSNEPAYAFIASFFTIIGFVIALLLWKDNKYIMHYAKQGLVLFIGQVLISIVASLPFIGRFVLGHLLGIFLMILWLITWINALSGKQKKTFIIGYLADKFKF